MRRTPIVAAVLAALGPAVAACGSSSSPASPQRLTAASSSPPGTSAHRLEHALLARAGPPRPTFASCRPATAAELSVAPFGPTHLPVFACLLTQRGTRARYDVQVLPNGCFVAERRRPGQAVYGCGAGAGKPRSRSACPRRALPLPPDALASAVRAALAYARHDRRGFSTQGARAVRAELAASPQAHAEEVRHECGARIARRTVVVELDLRTPVRSASLSEAVYFVARTMPSAYRVWYVAH